MELKNCIIYKAECGLGHSLKGLTHALRYARNKNLKPYIYGFKTLRGFEEYFHKYFYYNDNKNIEEIERLDSWTNNAELIKAIGHLRWDSGFKCFDEERKIYLYCRNGPMLNKTVSLHVNTHLIQNHLKFYNETYSLCKYKHCENMNNLYRLQLKAPYYKQLGVVNKTLGITDKDTFYKDKKELELVLEVENKGQKKTMTYKIEENKTIEIENIVSVKKAVYGIQEKTKDITKKVKKMICNYKVVELYDDTKMKGILESKNYIAVHFRNRDKKNDKSLILKEITLAIEKHKTNCVYIATDDPSFFDYVFESLPKICLMRYSFPPSGWKNVHSDANNGYVKGENLFKSLVDIYWCQSVRCKQFIGCKNSSFTNAINYLIFD